MKFARLFGAAAVVTGVDSEGVWESAVFGQFLRKVSSKRDLVFPTQIPWQREVGADVQPSNTPPTQISTHGESTSPRG